MLRFHELRAATLALLTVILCLNTSVANPSPQMRASIIGTWTGESICFGKRPACKDEVVVYRFEEVPGKPDQFTLFGDKIIKGKREPMGKLEFQQDQTTGLYSCEFRVGRTHGLIQLKLTGNTMQGTLVVLPGKKEGRRIKVKRVKEEQVPPAPARESYGAA